MYRQRFGHEDGNLNNDKTPLKNASDISSYSMRGTHISLNNTECRSPSSTITFQGSMLRMNGSPLHNIISNTPHNMSGSAETNFTSSSVLTRLPDSEARRPFRPSFGTSTSGVKNLSEDLEKAIDDTEHLNEFDDGDPASDEPTSDMWKGYSSIGPPNALCSDCGAIMWDVERNNKKSRNAAPTFSLCCKSGQVVLPPEKHAPEPLASLLYGGPKSTHFRKNIRVYNCMFAMCSSGGKIDHNINRGGAPFCFKIRGQNLHFIGSLIPDEGEKPKFCQLYIYDTDNEQSNRIGAVGAKVDDVDLDIVDSLTRMLDENNKLVSYFRTAQRRFKSNEQEDFKLVLMSALINVIPEEEFTIQMHRFEIIPLEDLQEHVVEGNPNWLNEFSIDVMGIVEDLEPIQEFQTNHGPVEIIKFTIYDGSVRHKVHISGPFNPDALSLYDDQFANPKIVIMASTRISEFRGTIKITNLSSTKIYVNLECPEVTTFRQWLINDGFMEFWPII
nr:PREDICTED: uncharacterized protein LOC108196575 [Daucus carota subsp. sativus]